MSKSKKRKEATVRAYMTQAHYRALKNLAGGHCVYCRAPGPLTRDHINPVSRGGRHHRSNIAPACNACNQAKADKPWRKFMVDSGMADRIPNVEEFIRKAKRLRPQAGKGT